MNSSELICPLCNKLYSQQNPPRLLTICGHTFCHKCVKTLITKKNNKIFKVKCPIDMTVVQIQKPQPSLFPKNIALVNMMNKAATKPTAIQTAEDKNEFLDQSVEKSTNILQQSYQANTKKTSQSYEKILQQEKSQPQKLCNTHEKILQIYCIDDCVKICTDCAIFGQHKSHRLKNTEAVDEEQYKCIQRLKQLKIKKKQCQERISDKQIEIEVLNLLDKKSGSLKQQIHQVIQNFRKQIDQLEKLLIQKLQSKTIQVTSRVKDKLSIEKSLAKKSSSWEKQVSKILSQNSQIQTRQELLIRAIHNSFYKACIDEGQAILARMNDQEQNLIGAVQMEIQHLKFVKVLSLPKPFKECFVIQTLKKASSTAKDFHQKDALSCTAKFNETKESSKKKSQNHNLAVPHFDDEEQSLLDIDDTTFDESRNVGLSNSKSCSNFDSESTILSPKPNESNTRLDKSHISKKQQNSNKKPVKRKLHIQEREASIHSAQMKKSRSKSIRTPKMSSKKRLDISDKQEKILQNLKKNVLDSLDLTGNDLTDQTVKEFLQALYTSTKVKNVKLLRNKLTDESIENIMSSCNNVQRLNLAQNKFTEQGLERILTYLQNNQSQIKYIHLGQNRIVERNNKVTLEEFKRLQISLVL